MVINNANNRSSRRDIYVQKTILQIIGEFFKKNMSALLYICETGDGKQEARIRLFVSWFEAYEFSNAFTCMTTSLRDSEGVFNSEGVEEQWRNSGGTVEGGLT